MKNALLKFRRNMKGIYLYFLISSLVIMIGLLIINAIYFSTIIDSLEMFADLFSSWISIILSFFIFLLNILGYKGFIKKMDYESFYDLRYKFCICVVLLGYIQFLLLGNFIVILILFYLINLYIIYEMFFSKTVYEINYYKDLDNKDKKKII